MAKRVVRRAASPVPPKRSKSAGLPKGSVREFHIPGGLPEPSEIRAEIEEMRDVLMGRREPPEFYRGKINGLMEVANGYFSRACEWEQLIYTGKAEGWLPKNRGYEQLRTQEIRSFKELAKGATELGSRRMTWESNQREHERRGLDAI